MADESLKSPRLVWMIGFAAFCLLPALAFIALHIRAPSDGARLSRELDIFTSQGAILSPYVSSSGPLQEGDVITAVGAVPMETWARALFNGGIERPDWALGETVRYQVLRDGRSLEVQIPLVPLDWSAVLQRHWGVLLFAFACQVVAGFVYLRRRDDPAALALFIWAFSGSHTYAWSFFMQVGDLVGGTGFWLFRMGTPLLWLIYWPAALHVALVFPRPLRVLQKAATLIPGIYIGSLAIFVGLLAWNWYRAENLLVWLNTWGPAGNLIAGLYLAATMAGLVLQTRRRLTGTERLQIRWVVFGAMVSGIGSLVLWIGFPLLTGRSAINANLLGLLVLPFPVSIALAIWRHHLFDIDVIIRRTLLYSTITLLLAGIFFAGVVLFQFVFDFLAGRPDSPLVTVLSTLAIAALFNPLRGRTQRFIDRRFYRQKYDAEQVLAQFAATARDEVDLERLASAMLGTVDDTLQPASTSLWLMPDLGLLTQSRKAGKAQGNPYDI